MTSQAPIVFSKTARNVDSGKISQSASIAFLRHLADHELAK